MLAFLKPLIHLFLGRALEAAATSLEAEKPALEEAAKAEGAQLKPLAIAAAQKALGAQHGVLAMLAPEIGVELNNVLDKEFAQGVTEIGPLVDKLAAYLRAEESKV